MSLLSSALGPVGPSTGWLSAKLGPSLEAHARILDRAGANAAEMVCYDQGRMRAMLTGALGSLQHVSLHLPGFHNKSEEDLQEELANLKAVVDRHGICGAPAHPDVTPAPVYGKLKAQGIPVAIENMDRQKDSGKTAEEIEQLGREHGSPFVLDVQHAYEVSRDSGGDGIELSRRFTEMMLAGNGISHLHVSGEITQQNKQLIIHAQLHVATNRREIVQAVRSVLERAEHPVPIILEGEYLLDVPYDYVPHDGAEREGLEERCADDIRREIECLKNEINA